MYLYWGFFSEMINSTYFQMSLWNDSLLLKAKINVYWRKEWLQAYLKNMNISAYGFFMIIATVKNSHKLHMLYTQAHINALIYLSIHDKTVRYYGITAVFSYWVSIYKEIQITTRKAE